MRYDGHAAWITGGGTGIGRALALELARQGADVAVSGRRADKIEAVAAEIEALGRRGLAVPCDVTDEGSIERAVAAVVDAFGKLDVVVANAGFAVAGSIESLDADAWRRQLDVNVVGAAITAKHALPELRKTKGRLGLVGSVSAFVPVSKIGAYAASKYAVRAIAQTLAIEVAGTGVSCTGIHPGFVESDINDVDNENRPKGEGKDTRPQQLMWKAEDAAKVIAKGLYKRKTELVFTGHGKIAAALGRHVPGLVVAVQRQNRLRRKKKRRG